jgi:hypothetical protein
MSKIYLQFLYGQVVVHKNNILEKPADATEAAAFMASYATVLPLHCVENSAFRIQCHGND